MSNFLSIFNISASGLTAQRARMDVIAENLANVSTTRTEAGGAYRRKVTILNEIPSESHFRTLLGDRMNGMRKLRATDRVAGGVAVGEIVEDQRFLKLVYDSDHSDSNEEGYVELPNVDTFKEMIDSMAASRAYNANIVAFNSAKYIAAKALEIGR